MHEEYLEWLPHFYSTCDWEILLLAVPGGDFSRKDFSAGGDVNRCEIRFWLPSVGTFLVQMKTSTKWIQSTPRGRATKVKFLTACNVNIIKIVFLFRRIISIMCLNWFCVHGVARSDNFLYNSEQLDWMKLFLFVDRIRCSIRSNTIRAHYLCFPNVALNLLRFSANS